MRCVVAAVLFGASAPAASELASELSPFTLAGLLYLGAGLVVLPASMRHQPQQMPGVGMTSVGLQNLPVQLFGLVQFTAAMQRHRLIQRLSDGKHATSAFAVK